jgi:hypothetical protein
MRLPIDTAAIKFAAAGPAEPVLDFASKAHKTDENGVPLFQVPVFAAGSGIKDSITVKVAGEVKGLSEFTLVKITNLIAQTWEVGDNHGVSFRADRVEVVKAAA